MLATTALQDGICTLSTAEEEAFLTRESVKQHDFLRKTPGIEDNVNRNNTMELSAK